MSGEYFRIGESVLMRLTKQQQKRLDRSANGSASSEYRRIDLSNENRHELIRQSFDMIAEKSLANGRVFVLGCYTQGEMNKSQIRRRTGFNAMCRAYCEARPGKFRYVDVDAIVPADNLVDKVHFTRAGYLAIARHILGFSTPSSGPLPENRTQTDLQVGQLS